MHDILVLVNGRPELVDELAEQPAELRAYVAAELTELLADRYFDYAIQDARGYGPVGGRRTSQDCPRAAWRDHC